MKIGDIVTRKSYEHDISFKVIRLKSNGQLELKGISLRLEADAPFSDLVKINSGRIMSLAETRIRLISSRKNIRKLALNTCWRNHVIHNSPRHT